VITHDLYEGGVGLRAHRKLHSNDDASPLINLLSCFLCEEAMKIEKSAPVRRARRMLTAATSFSTVARDALELNW
jgi:hypothetical protein